MLFLLAVLSNVNYNINKKIKKELLITLPVIFRAMFAL